MDAFLGGRLPFTGIAPVIERTLEAVPVTPVRHFSDLYATDAEARERARELTDAVPAE